MKKRLLSLLTVAALAAGAMTGCGSAQTSPESASETTPEAEDQTEAAEEAKAGDIEASEEEPVGLANPWVEITEEEANTKCLRLFKAPEGAEEPTWMECESLGDSDKGEGPLIQLGFSMDGTEFTARAQQGASEDADLSGLYVDWTVGPEDVTLANWGGGNMAGDTYRSISDSGYVDLITWYDEEIGISYSLSATAKDLDGFDIQAIAEQMYPGDDDAYGFMPDDFLQEQSGKTSFDSYDDVIAALKPGQGYAYIKLIGSDEDVLAVTDLVFEADHSAYEISVYGKPEGEVKQLGLVSGNGSAYPLRLEDGILYAGDNHSYETFFLSKEYGTLMVKDMIDDGVNSGSNKLMGYTREKNTYEDSTDFAGTQEDFEKLLAEREKKPAIEFTVIE